MRQRERVTLVVVETIAPPMTEPRTRLGGVPLLPRGAAWPACSWCGEPMEFVLQLRTRDLGRSHPILAAADGLLLVWRCADPTGACEPGAANGGASFATFTTLRGLRLAARGGEPAPCRGLAIGDARGGPVVGKAGADLDWRGAAAPLGCDDCARPLVPILQLDEPDGRRGYALFCDGCGDAVWCEDHAC
jgi:hypothetical protein